MAENTWLQELMKDIQILNQNKKLNFDISKFSPVLVEIATEIVNQQQLLDTIEKFGKVEGWVLASSEVKTLNNEPIITHSPLLNGEWVVQINGENISYLLEYLGDYQWSLQHCVFKDADLAQATHLAEKVTHKEVGVNSKRNLVYQKLWSNTQSALQADMAFFIGFDS